jgi:predicted kinase
MTKIILICGLVGAGKSTEARKLEAEQHMVRFALDEWLACLYSADQEDVMDYDWTMARIERIESQIWSMTQQIMNAGVSVVLDLGFLKQDHRQKFYGLAAQAGLAIEAHLIEADIETRWQRTGHRNEAQGETFSLNVTREMFDFCEEIFERPKDDELKICKVIKTD